MNTAHALGFVCAAGVAAGASSQGAPGESPATGERAVQIRSIDFTTGIIELFNFGATDEDLTGWRFCTHDFDQARRYTGAGGFTGTTIEAGTSLFIHFNNDAPGGDPDRLNRSSLAGSFAAPLDQDAYALQLYFPAANGNVSFGNSSLIADHVQWNIDGQGVGSAETRTNQAVGEQLWSASGAFVGTEGGSGRIDLTDLSGDLIGSPAEYAVSLPGSVLNEALAGDLSDDANAPSAIPLADGSNVIEGVVNLSNDVVAGDRDFFTVNVPSGRAITSVDLLRWDPDNLGFVALNDGTTGFVPGGGTSGQFLAGILVAASDVGDNLLDRFVDSSVTQNSLSQAELPAGDYTFVVQQTSDLLQRYALDIVLSEAAVQRFCGDVNADNVINDSDFFAWVTAFTSSDLIPCDVNDDGACNDSDFFAWVTIFTSGQNGPLCQPLS